MDKKYSAQIKLSLAALILFIGTFIAGTFYDMAAAETLFSPDNTIAKLITMLGIYPFYAAQVLFCGALFQQIINLNKRSPFRMSMCAACVFWAVFIGYIGGRSLTSANNLGSIFPSVTGSLPVIIILSMILMYPLFFVGYSASEKSEDKLLARRIQGLFCVLLILSHGTDHLMLRKQQPQNTVSAPTSSAPSQATTVYSVCCPCAYCPHLHGSSLSLKTSISVFSSAGLFSASL